MKGRNMYLPPDILKEIELIKIETGINSTSDALRVLARRGRKLTKEGFKI